MSLFKQKVIAAVDKVPYGTVASYGQIALYVGLPSTARQVGWILNSTEHDREVDIPWWRIVNNAGRISIKGSNSNTPDLQRKLLMAEGIIVKENFDLDIKAYRWHPTQDELNDLELPADYIKFVLEKYKI